MEYINNKLCIASSELIIKRDAHGNIISGVIEKYTYDHLTNKKKPLCEKIGYGGNGRDAYIVFDSILRPDIKNLIREKLGDPRKKADIKPFQDSIIPDPKAAEFFNNFRTDDGKALSESLIEKYCNDASILNAIHVIYTSFKTRRVAVGASTKHFWGKALKAVSDYRVSFKVRFERELPCTLPDSEKRLRLRYEEYRDGGYKALISKKIGNSNSEKLCDEAKWWILAQWANRINIIPGEKQMLAAYNSEATTRGWNLLDESKTIRNFLYRPDIQQLWYAHRYGELKAKEKFGFQHSTILPSRRDSLWYSDGTKLNYYYLNEDGKMETCQVYVVMDVYSECLLGYHISKTEDYIAQYNAFKMAIQFSGQRPYELKYDNQGGHKKLFTGDFLKKLAHLSIRTAPYNGKSKTIENAFLRVQSFVMKRNWNFTGQNVTSKKEESKPNMEYILTNKDRLPSFDEVCKQWKASFDEWNNEKHFKIENSHIAAYQESENDAAQRVNMWDMVELFWITREKEITCHASGITFIEKGEKHEYIVYTSNRMPDHVWLSANIDKKFTVKYDPDDMSLIYLYEKLPNTSELRFVTSAETKILVHRAKQEQEEWEAEYFKANEIEAKNLRIQRYNKMNEILEVHNLLPEQHGFKTPPIKGVSKRKKAVKVDIGVLEKAVSNAVLVDDEEYNENDIYKLY